MSWILEFRPEVADDVTEAADWYESRESGLGAVFVEEIIRVWEKIVEHPHIGSRRHPTMDIRWRYPERFPYRVIYRISEDTESILVVAVLHAARRDGGWQSRIGH
ncbi:MAG: type II toxin-antitoxin system RelE/ParE family toxin [Akkermansiaceae bacterium]|jgi:toxin ParE1/3/4|nr:type II toxin-antitoxin system RelE/ParE family toxin [Akkermansiaceae bacterium]MDP4646092.1 type II toxin-antitoxin system RelE/ParE family toxin [Akkermansiaceae bacterium]MDP4720891.1 type II toxin-antitoxin system RelE/ParE family toxin [Akkermansiaceae bacterium]MDP4780750.1 type II toxin-antitoxin system RelE/ParE family toxin [Akkermansiaceae bacterium]MDP4845696.1 type II toxin-antitoxin system RelE/ParE family toxin [Akkermansiaceae bacterium]